VGEWTRDDATFTYQWLRDGEPIPGKKGTEDTYKVRGNDVGHALSVSVTASVDGQSPVTVTSAEVEIDDDKPSRAQHALDLLRALLEWLRGLFG
jgi:hypothetical protein